MIINRAIQEKIEAKLFKKKAVIIYGARQVGKTTLIKTIQENYPDSLYLNCDEPDIQKALTDKNSTELESFLGNNKLVFVDEAQRVKNIGLTLKLIIDNFPQIQIVATGSSSFDLSNQITEPLTGRKYEFLLYPFSLAELKQMYSKLEITRLLERRIIFGMYPESVQNDYKAEDILKDICKSYLYKDILQYQQIKSPDLLEKLLQALALQIGNEVSYNELASTLQIDKKTVGHYIEILEKAFIIFRLKPFSRNLRKELSKLRKVYFVDTGIRNALIKNLNPLALRTDTGALWENFILSERIKSNNNIELEPNVYFWRTHQKQEVDYLEERGGKIEAYELKWNKTKIKPPKLFLDEYNVPEVKLVNKANFSEFLRF